ncbi:MAG: bifunctional folylpolyglutamate synthase/dihydrofolate synthase [Bacteroidales bacterium]|nr:bifunctional folylpolyglutamate synthase/dihydrofolate synthase [Bacteroidales bacterium]
MNYDETLHYLYNALPAFHKIGVAAYKEGLDNTLALDTRFNHPHRAYQTIHIAGTNGKGSISHTLAAIFQSAGYKTGLYTSPHLVDFRERIRVNGEMIDKEYVVDYVARNKEFFEQLHPSFFELTMMMAFCYFESQKVDIALIEVGLGGRLDSTNVITPELAIISNISFDHTQFLGDTLEKIAGEKAGIIKPHIPVVIGEAGTPEVRAVFLKKADQEKAPIFFAEEEQPLLSATKSSTGWVYTTKEYQQMEGELGGLAQKKNTVTVLSALKVLKEKGFKLPDTAIYKGFREVTSLTGLMGRWQIVRTHPKVICDTGHNSGGIQYVAEQLQQETYRTLRIVIGMVNDKDITAVLQLLPTSAIYYFTKAAIPRALDEHLLREQAIPFGLQGHDFHSVKEAVTTALQDCNPDDLLFIGGSNFIIAEALPLFQ